MAARVSDLRAMLQNQRHLEWSAIAGDTIDSVVATFLAVLELIRRGEISIAQEETFGPIRIFALEQSGAVRGHLGG